MTERPVAPLRVTIASADSAQRAELAHAVRRIAGHVDVVSQEDVGAHVVRERPDVAVVGWRTDPEDGLALVRRAAESRVCGVVAVLPARDEDLVPRAAACGTHAVALEGEGRLAGAIAIAAARHADYRDLQGAFARRAVTERAKGVLMERHGVDEQAAFGMLRSQARGRGRKLEDMAAAVLDSRPLLSRTARPAPVHSG